MLSGAELGKLAYEEWGRFGVPVFPCGSNKRPLGKWRDICSTDEQAIIDMFAARGARASHIGAAMGEDAGLFALDFDFYKGPEAKEYFDTLMLAGLLPLTRVHETKSGGIHYIYGVPEGQKAPRNSVPHDAVEVRGEGGYIIVPPTEGYSIQQDVEVEDAPLALIKRLARADAAFKSLSVSGLKEKIIAGESFHEAATSLAAKLHSAGYEPAEVTKQVREAMNASVAADPNHVRHDRWLGMMKGEDGELARLLSSAYKKYNPRRDQGDMEVVKSKMAKAMGNRPVTLGGFFAEKPKAEDDERKGVFGQEKKTATNTAAPDDFPFARSYNAAKVEQEDNKPFLIYPLVMSGDVVVLSAAPKAGKTLTTMNLCLHAAAGIPIGEDLIPMDSTGKTGKIGVIYFALEGQGAIRKRIRAWLKEQEASGRKMEEKDLHIYVVEQAINLADDTQRQDCVDKLLKANAYFNKLGWGDIGIVVFDTLTKAMPGKDQNSVEDTSSVFSTVDMMKEANLNPAVFFIHHNNKNGGGPRGSGNIMAEPDTLLSVKKADPIVEGGEAFDCYELSVFMARAVDDAQVYNFKAKSVDIGQNSQGIMETAPVVSLVENYAAAPKQKDAKLKASLEKSTAALYDAVWKALADAPDSTLTFGRLHRLMTQDKNPAVGAVYQQHLNGSGLENVKAAWAALLHKSRVPASLANMQFDVHDNGVTMRVELSNAVSG